MSPSERRSGADRRAGETFSALLERLHRERHTGAVVIHFAQGCPNAFEVVLRPDRIQLDKGERSPHT